VVLHPSEALTEHAPLPAWDDRSLAAGRG
jgi:hypothetical protein